MAPELRAQLQAHLGSAYTIERELGRGGMATVYLAEDRKHHRQVAIKVLHPEIAAALGLERFLREIEIAAKLQHPHIVPLLDSGQAEGFLYYVMPFVKGESLREKLVRERELPVPEAARILRDVADALAHAHEAGVVHRDIKPENVMLSGRHALVTDFGVAKAISEATGRQQLTTAGVALGTPAYMAPEQAAADPHTDHRVDIYALGILGYEMLTGAPPFVGSAPQAVLSAHVTQAPTPVSERREVPPGLAELVMKCLKKKPADRWQKAEELVPPLEGFTTASGGITPTDTQPVGAVQRPGKRWAGLSVVVVAIGLGIWSWRARGSAPGSGSAHTIAVIPLTVANADTAEEYFSDGITDELTTALAQVPGLAVINRGSAFQFKGTSVNPRDVASKLGVDHIVELRVRRTGPSMRVDADLVNCANGVAMWSQGYQRDIREARAMQDDISGAIVAALRVRTAGPLRGKRREPTPEAFEAYLRGRHILNHAAAKPDFERALEYFHQAMAADTGFAEAYAATAFLYGIASGIMFPPLEGYSNAENLARQAIELDDGNAEAHAALGAAIAVLHWDWPAAQREFERALALNPSNALAHFSYGFFLGTTRGNPRRGLKEYQMSARLDPAFAGTGMMLVISWVDLGQPDSAIAAQRRGDELNPGFMLLESFVSDAYRQKGLLDTALALDRAVSAHEGHPTSGLVVSLVALGRRAEAQAAYREMVRANQRQTMYGEVLGRAAFALGDREGAIGWFEKAVDMHSDWLFWLLRPELKPLLSDPRYQRLLDRVHLPH